MKPGKVRPLALCVLRRDDHLFVAEGYDDLKKQAFYRPLGGKIEFGEYGRETVMRELLEEINQPVIVERYLGALENIFTYNGQQGHEIVLLYEGVFVDKTLYTCESVEGRDDDMLLFVAKWLPLAFFQQGTAPLYPDGLLEMLNP